MNIFDKGNYQPVSSDFRTLGYESLQSISQFQEKFEIFDTDTTINSIRDSIVANYLNYDLLNQAKHGFDAKCSITNNYLEIKQCSISSKRWGGTWNDTNIEKAQAFSDPRLYTAVAIWKGASDLQFMVYGQNPSVGQYLLERVQSIITKEDKTKVKRSTQNIAIDDLLNKSNFSIIAPPSKTKQYVKELIVLYKRSLAKYIEDNDVKTISDI